jgi:hypothetical protein
LADAMVIGQIRTAVTADTQGANGSVPNEKKKGKLLSEQLAFPRRTGNLKSSAAVRLR